MSARVSVMLGGVEHRLTPDEAGRVYDQVAEVGVLRLVVLRAAIRDACEIAEQWMRAAFEMAPDSSMLGRMANETEPKLAALRKMGER